MSIRILPPPEREFRHGEPVWASVEGYPWWPGHIVSRSEVILDKGEPLPRVRQGELLVEFFNDNKRFAPMRESNLRSFLSRRFTRLNSGYSGVYKEDVDIAVTEAKDYCQEKGYEMEDDSGHNSRPASPTTISPPEQGLGRKRKKKTPAKRAARKQEDGLERHDLKRVKKERTLVRPRSISAEDIRDNGHGNRDKPARENLKLECEKPCTLEADHGKNIPPRVDENPRKQRWEDDEGVEDKEGQVPDESDNNLVKWNSLEGIAKEILSDLQKIRFRASLLKDPTFLAKGCELTRKSAKYSLDVAKGFRELHVQWAGILNIEHVSGEYTVPERRVERVEAEPLSMDLDNCPGDQDRSVEKGFDTNFIDEAMVTSGTKDTMKTGVMSPDKKSPEPKTTDTADGSEPTEAATEQRPSGKDNIPTGPSVTVIRTANKREHSPVEGEVVASTSLTGEAPFEEGVAYRSLSKEDLINLVFAKDKELQTLRVRLQPHRLQNGKQSSLAGMDDLRATVAPCFKAVADFLAVSELEAYRDRKSPRCRMLETLAIEKLSGLQQGQFDRSLLKDDLTLCARGRKLVRKSGKYSLEVAKLLRELLVQ